VRLLALRPLLDYCASLGWWWRWLWRSRWNVDWQGKPKLSEKTCPSVTFVHHKISHDQTRVWTRAAAMGSRRLTAWAMARPSEVFYFIRSDFPFGSCDQFLHFALAVITCAVASRHIGVFCVWRWGQRSLNVLLFTRFTHMCAAFTFTVSCVINLTVVSAEHVSLQLSYLACHKIPFTHCAAVCTQSFDF
jgi:hypothetical protein